MAEFSYGSARVTGMSHRNVNQPCQDSINLKVIDADKDKYLVMAVADGHGHRQHDLSATGSKLATASAVEVAEFGIRKYGNAYLDRFNETFANDVCHSWSQRILEDSMIRGIQFDPVRYGTTLTTAIMYGNTIVIGKIGDGSVVVKTGNDSIVLWAEDEEIRSNRTSSLCQIDAITRFEFERIDDCGGVLLATDGLVNSLPTFKNLETILEYFLCQLSSSALSTGVEHAIWGLAEQCAVGGACDDTTIVAAMPIK